MAYQQTVNMYDPIDTNAVQWKAGMTARDTGAEMEKARRALLATSQGPDPYEQRDNDRYAAEQALMQREQQRREFDSQTARETQREKHSVLRGLLGGGMTGQKSFSRTFGDNPASHSRY